MRAEFKHNIKIKLLCYFCSSMMLLVGLFFLSAGMNQIGMLGLLAFLGCLLWGSQKIHLLCYTKKREIHKTYLFLGIICYRDIFPINQDAQFILRTEKISQDMNGNYQEVCYLELEAPDMKGIGGLLEIIRVVDENDVMRLPKIAKRISEKLGIPLSNK